MLTDEQFLPEPSLSEFEVTIGKMKSYKSLDGGQISEKTDQGKM
jgi:hypothetical protein